VTIEVDRGGLTGFRPPFLFWTGAASCAVGPRSPSGSGDEMDELVKPSSRGSSLGTTESGPVASAAVMSAAAIDPIPAGVSLTKPPPPVVSNARLGKIDARLADALRLREAKGQVSWLKNGIRDKEKDRDRTKHDQEIAVR
jgi:hypothetical protein